MSVSSYEESNEWIEMIFPHTKCAFYTIEFKMVMILFSQDFRPKKKMKKNRKISEESMDDCGTHWIWTMNRSFGMEFKGGSEKHVKLAQ